MAIQHRRGTAAAATSANVVLAAGQLGVETDTGKVKVGDGTTAWTSLPYAGGGSGTGLPNGGTVGQVLAKQSATNGDANWQTTAALSNAIPLSAGMAVAGTSGDASRGDHVHGLRAPVKMVTGWAYAASSGANTTPGNGSAAVIPYIIPNAVVISQMAFRLVTTVAGSVFRIGVWADNAGLPGARVHDSGDITVGGTQHFPTGGLSLPAGVFWIGIVPQNATLSTYQGADPNSSRIASGSMQKMNGTALDTNLVGAAPVATGIAAGALPDPFPSFVTYPNQVAAARIWLCV